MEASTGEAVVIPIASTTITITRSSIDGDVEQPADPYDPTPPVVSEVASGVRAVIGVPSATTTLVGGTREVYQAKLTCDPVDLQAGDVVTDDEDGTAWTVLWARPSSGFGLDNMLAQLRLTVGAT